MKRRTFLGSILAAGMAPAIVKAEILMPVRKIIVPDPFGTFGWTRIPGYTAMTAEYVDKASAGIEDITLTVDEYLYNSLPDWYTSQVKLTQADQRALNREYRRLMDNPAPTPPYVTEHQWMTLTGRERAPDGTIRDLPNWRDVVRSNKAEIDRMYGRGKTQ